MGALEEQARFLTAKYGTAAGPVGLPHGAGSVGVTGDVATVMVLLGLLLFASIIFVLLRDYLALDRARKARQELYIQ